MTKPAIEKTTLGAVVGLGIATPDGDPVRVVDALQECWVLWPLSPDEQASVYLTEADALFWQSVLARRQSEDESQ